MKQHIKRLARKAVRRWWGARLRPDELRLAKNLLAQVEYESYERAVAGMHDRYPGWNDGGQDVIRNLWERLQ